MKDGSGFVTLADLGRVTTGATQMQPADGQAFDGNLTQNLLQFDPVLLA
jgi:hypothetical protein